MQEAAHAPISTLIVDDEDLARQLIGSLIRRDPALKLIGECADGARALDAVAQLHPDLVFLDVQMPVMDGVSVAERIAQQGHRPFVVFITAYDEYAIRAFELNALDYLVKPLSKRRFSAAVERAKRAVRNKEIVDLADRLAALGRSELKADFGTESGEQEVTVRVGGEIVQLVTRDIDWIEAANQYVHIHAAGRCYTVSESLGQYARHIKDPRFFRVHRSALVNGAAVRRVSKQRNGTHLLKLRGGEALVLARSRAALVPNLLRVVRQSRTGS